MRRFSEKSLISMVVVLREFQGKGFMYSVLGQPFAEAASEGILCVLDTDTPLKVNNISGAVWSCAASVYFYKHLLLSGDSGALEKTIKFGEYFLLPGMALFLVFLITLIAVQISGFAKGKTPYPKWCWIFSLTFGVLAVLLTEAAGNNAFFNGLSTAWISIGDIWMTGGLFLTMNKAERMENK